MTFEFKGVDIEQPAGQQLFIEVYDGISSIGGPTHVEYLDEFRDSDLYSTWIDENEEVATGFLQTLIENESPHIRILAGKIADEWAVKNPDLTTEIYEKVLSDKDQLVVDDRKLFIQDFLTDYGWEEERNALGLERLARIIRAYKRASDRAEPTPS